MRISVVGQDFPESFSTFISAALQRMGHESKVFRSPASLIVFNRYIEIATRLVLSSFESAARSAERLMVRKILEWDPELVISTDINLWPQTIIELKKAGSRVVAWCPDALVNFGRQFFYLAPYDVVFLKDPYVIRHAREFASLPVEYLPEACDPTVHRPVEPDESERSRFECDIIHYGNAYPSKVKALERIMALGYDFKAYGRSFPSWIRSPVEAVWSREFLAGSTKAAALRSAKITLNMLHYGEIEGANARLFEAAGCGAFQLVEWRRSMDELFEHGKEVVYFQSFSELEKSIEYWLPRAEERRAIADAASRRAHAEHTYEHRLHRLLQRSI
jgi:spore maturation protein CgeB